MSVFEDIKTGLNQAIEYEKQNKQIKKTEKIMQALNAFDGKAVILYDPTNNETITFEDVIDYVIDLQSEVEEYEAVFDLYNNRKYRKMFIEEWKKEYQKELDKQGEGVIAGFPDSDYVYRRYFEQKAEIERLNDMKFTQEHCNLYEENELLKDMLRQYMNGEIVNENVFAQQVEEIKQVRKYTAKEIYGEIDDSDILVVETQEYGEIEVVSMERLKEIIKSKGVEVE